MNHKLKVSTIRNDESRSMSDFPVVPGVGWNTGRRLSISFWGLNSYLSKNQTSGLKKTGQIGQKAVGYVNYFCFVAITK
jgi:hypothetical protein